MIHTTQNRTTGSTILSFATLLALMAASLLLAAMPAHASTTFTVTNTNDSGPGSLRQAILDANATTGADIINFNIAGTGVHTIAPASQLPTITGPVTINGYSQPGAEPNTRAVGTDAALKIMLSGAKTVGADGLVIGASNSTVKGLVINQWQYVGIRILGSSAAGNKITGNYIGTDPDGAGAYQGNLRGVYVPDGSNNVIGGTTPAARNVISYNLEFGISIDGGVGTRVLGNYIGTDASGTQDFGNNGSGINIEGSLDTVIGGTTAAERNVISGNQHDGVGIYATGVRVTGNFIGTDATGTQDLGNTRHGVSIEGGKNNAVGATSGARNVISGNGDSGVRISGPNATGNKVMGNYIGADKNGAALGNSANGVYISSTSNNTVGGTTAAGRNVISGNDGSGVSISGDTATGNRILHNSMFANGGLGIDLGDDGPTANDPGDADPGPNNLQNKPGITSARTGSLKTTIKGSLNSTPNKTFLIQFFSNPSGTDEGKTFIGQKTVTTDASGNATFIFSPSQKVGVGRTVTATATGPGGNTSEFSAPRSVV